MLSRRSRATLTKAILRGQGNLKTSYKMTAAQLADVCCVDNAAVVNTGHDALCCRSLRPIDRGGAMTTARFKTRLTGETSNIMIYQSPSKDLAATLSLKIRPWPRCTENGRKRWGALAEVLLKDAKVSVQNWRHQELENSMCEL